MKLETDLNGFLNIDKPVDWSSHDVVAKMRRILNMKKIGHAGTLDPFATGVLPLAIGSGTRLIRFLGKSKRYTAEINFEFLTDTDDLTGENIGPGRSWTEDKLKQALTKFIGEIVQVPPLYSATHHNGTKLYELMRSGAQIDLTEIKKKKVHIKSIDLLKFDFPKVEIDISCGEGTYIRSIARDLGGHLTKLRRTESNGFDLESTVTIHELEEILSAKPEEVNDFLVPAHEVVDLPLIEFNDQEAMDLQQGKRIILNLGSSELKSLENNEFIQCIDQSQELIGVGSVHKRRGDSLLVQPKVIL